MNKFTLALAAVLGLGILAPTAAEAGGCRSRVSTDRCGYTVYYEYQFVGRNCHGRPIYEWVVVRRVPPCDRGHGCGGGSYQGGRGGHYPSRPHCGTGHRFARGR